ncbi:MAG: hypothetical protein AAGJ34_11195 [Pseudomonadota bacterium]
MFGAIALVTLIGYGVMSNVLGQPRSSLSAIEIDDTFLGKFPEKIHYRDTGFRLNENIDLETYDITGRFKRLDASIEVSTIDIFVVREWRSVQHIEFGKGLDDVRNELLSLPSNEPAWVYVFDGEKSSKVLYFINASALGNCRASDVSKYILASMYTGFDPVRWENSTSFVTQCID